MLVDDTFLERNNGVVGDRNVLRANLGATLGDVAVTDAVTFFQLVGSIEDVERMHLELRGVNQKSRAHELLVELMIAKNVADILAQKALDALPEFLNAVHVGL